MVFLRSLFALMACVPAFAITIAINDPTIPIGTVGTPVLQAGYRPSSTAVDAYLSPYDGVGGAGTTAVTANLGTFTALKGQLWNFTVTNAPGSNLTLSMTPAAGGTTTNLIWGTGGTPTLTAPGGTSYGPQARPYNALELLLVTPQGNNSGSLLNLSLLIDGMDPFYTPNSAGFVTGSFTNSNPGALTPQWILANSYVDLGQYQWTLSGQIALNATGNNEGVAFRINGRSVEAQFAGTPEPSAYLLMGTVAGALFLLRRRRLSAEKPQDRSLE